MLPPAKPMIGVAPLLSGALIITGAPTDLSRRLRGRYLEELCQALVAYIRVGGDIRLRSERSAEGLTLKFEIRDTVRFDRAVGQRLKIGRLPTELPAPHVREQLTEATSRPDGAG